MVQAIVDGRPPSAVEIARLSLSRRTSLLSAVSSVSRSLLCSRWAVNCATRRALSLTLPVADRASLRSALSAVSWASRSLLCCRALLGCAVDCAAWRALSLTLQSCLSLFSTFRSTVPFFTFLSTTHACFSSLLRVHDLWLCRRLPL